METTDWDAYGTGNYEKCANCMAHCGYEPTAADAMLSATRCKALKVALRGIAHRGPDGAGNPARQAASGANSCSHATSSRSSPRSGQPKPGPSSWRPRSSAASAARAFSAERGSGPAICRAARSSERSTAAMSIVPSARMAASAAGGKARSPDRRRPGGPRTAARARGRPAPRRGIPCRPRPRRSRACSGALGLGRRRPARRRRSTSTDAMAPEIVRERDARVQSRDRSAMPASVRRRPSRRPRRRPAADPGSSPPAMPKLMTPATAVARSRASAAAQASRPLAAADDVAMPGPAAMRASRASPATTIIDARPSISHSERVRSDCCRASGCGSARAPTAGRTSRSRDSADRTRAGNPSRCNALSFQKPSAPWRRSR